MKRCLTLCGLAAALALGLPHLAGCRNGHTRSPAKHAAKGKKCLKPARGPILQAATVGPKALAAPERATRPRARVGRPAPDFEALAFHRGKFKTLRLSALRGKWVLLYFYPSDFTFV